MAFNQLGTPTLVKGIEGQIPAITISGVTIFSSVNITQGYRTITEIIGNDGETAAVVMAGQDNLDVTINGYLEGSNTPKNGDEVDVEGFGIAWIDGVSVAYTPEGVATVSATVHARKKTTATT